MKNHAESTSKYYTGLFTTTVVLYLLFNFSISVSEKYEFEEPPTSIATLRLFINILLPSAGRLCEGDASKQLSMAYDIRIL